MNGNIGCLPDNNEIHDSYKSAFESACNLFDELTKKEMNELKKYGILYLSGNRMHILGAEVIEIAECSDSMCSEELDDY
jgi:hypothetical protein